MRVLLVTTYYRPHISGLTIHVQRIAEGLAARGHAVTVVTSRYEPSLPAALSREIPRLLERACRAAFNRATDASGGVLASSADYARSSPGLAALQEPCGAGRAAGIREGGGVPAGRAARGRASGGTSPLDHHGRPGAGRW